MYTHTDVFATTVVWNSLRKISALCRKAFTSFLPLFVFSPGKLFFLSLCLTVMLGLLFLFLLVFLVSLFPIAIY